MIFPFNMVTRQLSPSRLVDRTSAVVSQPQTVKERQEIIASMTPSKRGLASFRKRQDIQRESESYGDRAKAITDLFSQYEQEREDYSKSLETWMPEEQRAKERGEFEAKSKQIIGEIEQLDKSYMKVTGMKSGSYPQLISDLQRERESFINYEFGGREKGLTDQFNRLSLTERYAYGDPRITGYVDLDRRREFLIDTGERFTGTIEGRQFDNEVVYNVKGQKFIGRPTIESLERSGGRQDDILSGYMVSGNDIFTLKPRYTRDGYKRLDMTKVAEGYKPSQVINIPFNVDNLQPRNYQDFVRTQYALPPQPNLKPEYFNRYPQLISGVTVDTSPKPRTVMMKTATGNTFEVKPPSASGRTASGFVNTLWYKSQTGDIQQEFRKQNQFISKKQQTLYNKGRKKPNVGDAFNKIFTDVKLYGETKALSRRENVKLAKGLSDLGILKFS